MTKAAITIDVDALRCYAEIHGLATVEDEDPIFGRALPRFLELCESFGIRSTLFVVARDLENTLAKKSIRAALDAGHEIASHSDQHDYSLSQRSRLLIEKDFSDAEERFQKHLGMKPLGFRAPGYNQSEGLMDALETRDYLYDSSFFPTPAYFSARATAIGLYRLQKRPTHSLVGDLREFLAPRSPFLPAHGYRYRPAENAETSRRLLEIPMSVSSVFRLPWLGTTLTTVPSFIGEQMTKSALRNSPFCVLELHAIDFLDADDVGNEKLIRAQPDLRIPWATKKERLGRSFARLKDERRIIRLVDFAHSFVGS